MKWPFANNKVQMLYREMFSRTGNWLITETAINASWLSASVCWGGSSTAMALVPNCLWEWEVHEKKKENFPLPWTHSGKCVAHCLQLTQPAYPACSSAETSAQTRGLWRLVFVSTFRRMLVDVRKLSAKTPAERNYRLRSLVNLPVSHLVSSL